MQCVRRGTERGGRRKYVDRRDTEIGDEGRKGGNRLVEKARGGRGTRRKRAREREVGGGRRARAMGVWGGLMEHTLSHSGDPAVDRNRAAMLCNSSARSSIFCVWAAGYSRPCSSSSKGHAARGQATMYQSLPTTGAPGWSTRVFGRRGRGGEGRLRI